MISIILPIYNIKTEYLRECFSSLQRQTMPDFEALLVDDGSEVYVEKLCMEFTGNDSRFRYIRQENAGVCVARNSGLDVARGEYLCFADPDDWLSEQYLATMYNCLAATGADVALVDCQVHYEKHIAENHFLGGGAGVLTGVEKNRLLYQLFGRKICSYYPLELPAGTAWAKMFRTAFLRENNLHFLPGLPRMEDILFCMHAYEAAEKIAYQPDCLYHYRVSGDSVSHRYDPDVIQNFECFFEAAKQFLDRNGKEQLLYDALAMRELTAVHSYMRFYYFRDPELSMADANRQINALLDREPYSSALQNINYGLLSKTEAIFVHALKARNYPLLRALVKGRELLRK